MKILNTDSESSRLQLLNHTNFIQKFLDSGVPARCKIEKISKSVFFFQKKQRKQAVRSDELSNSGNSSKSDSEDSDDIEKYSEEAKNRVYDWTPEENMRMIDNLRMKMLKMVSTREN